MNEGRERESEVDEEGGQTAAPVPSWLLEPSVKMSVAEPEERIRERDRRAWRKR